MTIGSKSQSNDRENDLDRMEMMEDNGHEEGNIRPGWGQHGNSRICISRR